MKRTACLLRSCPTPAKPMSSAARRMRVSSSGASTPKRSAQASKKMSSAAYEVIIASPLDWIGFSLHKEHGLMALRLLKPLHQLWNHSLHDCASMAGLDSHYREPPCITALLKILMIAVHVSNEGQALHATASLMLHPAIEGPVVH